MLEKFEWHIIPLMNPDGYQYSIKKKIYHYSNIKKTYKYFNIEKYILTFNISKNIPIFEVPIVQFLKKIYQFSRYQYSRTVDRYWRKNTVR